MNNLFMAHAPCPPPCYLSRDPHPAIPRRVNNPSGFRQWNFATIPLPLHAVPKRLPRGQSTVLRLGRGGTGSGPGVEGYPCGLSLFEEYRFRSRTGTKRLCGQGGGHDSQNTGNAWKIRLHVSRNICPGEDLIEKKVRVLPALRAPESARGLLPAGGEPRSRSRLPPRADSAGCGHCSPARPRMCAFPA
jgi:hypothetical protein